MWRLHMCISPIFSQGCIARIFLGDGGQKEKGVKFRKGSKKLYFLTSFRKNAIFILTKYAQTKIKFAFKGLERIRGKRGANRESCARKLTGHKVWHATSTEQTFFTNFDKAISSNSNCAWTSALLTRNISLQAIWVSLCDWLQYSLQIKKLDIKSLN